MTAGNAVGNVLAMPVKPRQRPEQHQQTEAERLRRLWEMRKQQHGWTQDDAAKSMGIKQTLVSHYLNGRKRLGTEALLRWAKFLQVSPLDIRPDFEYRDMIPGKLSPPQVEVADMWGRLPDTIAVTFREQLRSMLKHLKQGNG